MGDLLPDATAGLLLASVRVIQRELPLQLFKIKNKFLSDELDALLLPTIKQHQYGLTRAGVCNL